MSMFNIKSTESANIPKLTEEEYYDLTPNTKLDGSFTNAVTTMSKEGKIASENINIRNYEFSNILDKREAFTAVSMSDNFGMDVDSKDTIVQNPHGYGYIPSLNEAKIQDSQDILNQESSIFSIGAVAGVSLIVLGILITSAQNASN